MATLGTRRGRQDRSSAVWSNFNASQRAVAIVCRPTPFWPTARLLANIAGSDMEQRSEETRDAMDLTLRSWTLAFSVCANDDRRPQIFRWACIPAAASTAGRAASIPATISSAFKLLQCKSLNRLNGLTESFTGCVRPLASLSPLMRSLSAAVRQRAGMTESSLSYCARREIHEVS